MPGQPLAPPGAYLLDGIALSHKGDVLALFHKYGPQMGWDLGRAFVRLLPHAEICTQDFEWVVARAPEVLTLFLKERDHGLLGLVLESERTRAFDARKCALFLRNLLVDLGCGDLAPYVRELAAEPGAVLDAQVDDSGTRTARLHWQLQGFGYGFQDHGLTRERCLTALRAARDGKQLRAPSAATRKRR